MRLRILLFEDDESIRQLVARILNDRDYELIAYDHPCRCEILQSPKCECHEGYQCADVIMFDRHFYGVDCIDFIKKQRSRGCKARFIAILSAVLSWDEEEWAEESGVDVFRKPFSADTIRDWLEQCEARSDPNRKLVSLTDDIV